MKNYFLTLIAILLSSNPIISQQRNCDNATFRIFETRTLILEQKMLQNEENIKTWILNNTNRLSQNIITIPLLYMSFIIITQKTSAINKFFHK